MSIKFTKFADIYVWSWIGRTHELLNGSNYDDFYDSDDPCDRRAEVGEDHGSGSCPRTLPVMESDLREPQNAQLRHRSRMAH